MASSKKTLNQDERRQDDRRQDGRRKDTEKCISRLIEVEGVRGRRKSLRDDLRDRDHKPENTSWDNTFKKFCMPGANAIAA
jgi:hypothetical protein